MSWRKSPGVGCKTLSGIAVALYLCVGTRAFAETRDFADEIIYFVLTDRFCNGDERNDQGGGNTGDAHNPANPNGWHGGDFAGLSQKIEDGYFRALGVTALWISPVVQQVPSPGEGGGPNSGLPSTGYHGYWAEDFFSIEPHFGTEGELQDLIQLAHEHGLKVIVDMVVNHAGYQASLVAEQPDWFRTGTECGNDDVTQCLAGLPDFIQEVPEVQQFLFESVFFLRDQFEIDGIRMDTMKHVPDAFWKEFFATEGPGDPALVWTVGEIFSGETARLAHYQKVLGSPSVLDFPLYLAITNALARGGSAAQLADVFANDKLYQDPNALSVFLDNHDVPRFASVARQAGFDREATIQRLDAALSLLYTARGIPVLYYGTEIGMEGEGDPYRLPLGRTNREDMDFGAVAEAGIDQRLAALAAARHAYPALVRGRQSTLWPADPEWTALQPSADAAQVFAVDLFVRGSFDAWTHPPPASRKLVNLGDGRYAAEFDLSKGRYEFKIAASDWSVERVTDANFLVKPDLTVSLTSPGAGAPNGRVVIPSDGRYRWSVDATDPEKLTLAVRRVGDSLNLLAFQRELRGEATVVAVLNNSDSAIDLAATTNGGIPCFAALPAGKKLHEVTGRSHALQVKGKTLTGIVPARTLLAVTSQ
jgi:glycosidase